MEFAHPQFLLLLLLLPILILWYFKKGYNLESTIRFSNIKLLPEKMVYNGKIINRISIIFRLFIIFLIIVALARPRLENTIKETKAEIVDILLVIDQSSSMLAQDFKPNRLEAAKEVAKEFIKDRQSDRLGIIVFAGDSFIQCPLTTDIDILLEFTDQIEIIEREYDGTAIGMAIANATNRLRDSDSKSKIIILLSDGSNNKGEIEPITAAELSANFNIKIYTIAAGKHGSAPYPVTDAWGRKILQNIQVQVDEESLKEIANITGGRFFRATDNQSLRKIYKEIDQLERTEIKISEYQNYTELYSWITIPIAFASLFFVFVSRGIYYKFF